MLCSLRLSVCLCEGSEIERWEGREDRDDTRRERIRRKGGRKGRARRSKVESEEGREC